MDHSIKVLKLMNWSKVVTNPWMSHYLVVSQGMQINRNVYHIVNNNITEIWIFNFKRKRLWQNICHDLCSVSHRLLIYCQPLFIILNLIKSLKMNSFFIFWLYWEPLMLSRWIGELLGGQSMKKSTFLIDKPGFPNLSVQRYRGPDRVSLSG